VRAEEGKGARLLSTITTPASLRVRVQPEGYRQRCVEARLEFAPTVRRDNVLLAAVVVGKKTLAMPALAEPDFGALALSG
jgi:hypothetical protein